MGEGREGERVGEGALGLKLKIKSLQTSRQTQRGAVDIVMKRGVLWGKGGSKYNVRKMKNIPLSLLSSLSPTVSSSSPPPSIL